MLLAALVVGKLRATECLDSSVAGDLARATFIWRRGFDGRFQRRKGNARVASSRVSEALECFVGHDRTQFAKSSFFIFDCALENCFHFALRQWIEDQHA